MKGIRIGKWQPLGGIRLKSWAIYTILLLLALGNVVAGLMEWHDASAMMVFNGFCIVLLVMAVMHKILNMEPRKMWRMLAFLLSVSGVLAVFCSSFLEGELEQWLNILLFAAGAMLILLGGVSMVMWRRYSLAHKQELQNTRRKSN